MATEVDIEVEGLDELMAKFHRAPSMIGRDLGQGMKVAIDTVLDERGLRRYPPRTDANRPPPPYYRRGYGKVTKSGRRLSNSERLGTQFFSNVGLAGANVIGIVQQRASYGQYVVGDKQPNHMRRKGWKKMKNVFREQAPEIGRILEKFVARSLWKMGLVDQIADVWRD